MQRLILTATLAASLAVAQHEPATDVERVVAVLKSGDAVADAKLGVPLLETGALDDAIRAVARSEATERTARLRALRLVRCLDLAASIRGSAKRDLGWWLALHEIGREVPASVARCLLKRAFADDRVCSKALEELDAASEVAKRFCTEWNEIREAKDAEKYDALEAELKKAAPAAVPALFDLLSVPSWVAFSGPQAGQPVDARQQVRAILGLAAVLELEQALPFFVVHAAGPSLTQSTHAAMAVQRFSGEHFGAAFMVDGDDAALVAWWRKHRAEHRVVLDYVHHRMLQWARAAIEATTPRPADSFWGAAMCLNRAVGEVREVRPEADVGAMRTRLEEIETSWVLAPR